MRTNATKLLQASTTEIFIWVSIAAALIFAATIAAFACAKVMFIIF